MTPAEKTMLAELDAPASEFKRGCEEAAAALDRALAGIAQTRAQFDRPAARTPSRASTPDGRPATDMHAPDRRVVRLETIVEIARPDGAVLRIASGNPGGPTSGQ